MSIKIGLKFEKSSQISWNFVAFSVATFLSFLGTSSISFFSVILEDVGMNQETIGWILSSALPSAVIAIFVCGELLSRYKALQIVLVGQIISFLGYASFFISIADPFWASISRLIVGAGFGLFFPAALIYARTLVGGHNAVFLFGIYSTMIPLPNLFGPGAAELIYGKLGIWAVLMAFSICIVAGIILTMFLPAMDRSERPKSVVPFRTILTCRETLLPHLSIVIVGMLWGFMLSFIALYLHKAGVRSPIFFTTATAVMVISRFTVMSWLGQRPHKVVAGLGLLLMASGYAVLPINPSNVWLVLGAAGIFGLGYSFAFPVLSLWATDRYLVTERGRPMAVFTAFFQGSIFLTPLLVGLWTKIGVLDDVLIILACISTVLSVVLFVSFLLVKAERNFPAAGH